MERIEDPLRAMTELVRINISLSTERDLHTLLEMIVSAARRLTGAEVGRIFVLDRTKRYLDLEVTQEPAREARAPSGSRAAGSAGAATAATQARVALIGDHGPNTADVCVYSAISGQLVNIEDVYRYTGFDFSTLYLADRARGNRTRCLITVPLRGSEETTVGVLQLANSADRRAGDRSGNPAGDAEASPGGFDAALEELVRAFAAQAAVVIDNVKLLDEKRRLIEVLDTTNRDLRAENRTLRATKAGIERPNIIGDSPGMQRLFELIGKIAESDVTVLIRGETGTGKELIARVIFQNSPRAKRPFVAQNCAAVPEGLLESELFGYRRGAFTGAVGDKRGLFEQADGGTLFLDEIGDLPMELQAKLLRVLQEGEFRPLGAVENRRVDVRVIAATHRDLEAQIEAGGFREDLYYRLTVFPVSVPPLRERRADLPVLVDHFIRTYAKRYNKVIRGVAPDALAILLDHDYPGNVRELQNLVERAVLLAESGGSLLGEHLPLLSARAGLAGGPGGGAAGVAVPGDPALDPEAGLGAVCGAGLRQLVRNYEARLIAAQLQANNWNQTRTAALLQIPRRTLVEKIGRYQLDREAS